MPITARATLFQKLTLPAPSQSRIFHIAISSDSLTLLVSSSDYQLHVYKRGCLEEEFEYSGAVRPPTGSAFITAIALRSDGEEGLYGNTYGVLRYFGVRNNPHARRVGQVISSEDKEDGRVAGCGISKNYVVGSFWEDDNDAIGHGRRKMLVWKRDERQGMKVIMTLGWKKCIGEGWIERCIVVDAPVGWVGYIEGLKGGERKVKLKKIEERNEWTGDNQGGNWAGKTENEMHMEFHVGVVRALRLVGCDLGGDNQERMWRGDFTIGVEIIEGRCMSQYQENEHGGISKEEWCVEGLPVDGGCDLSDFVGNGSREVVAVIAKDGWGGVDVFELERN